MEEKEEEREEEMEAEVRKKNKREEVGEEDGRIYHLPITGKANDEASHNNPPIPHVIFR